MCLVIGRLQFGRFAAVEEETPRDQAAQSDLVGRAAAEGPEDADHHHQRQVGPGDEEVPPEVAERRLRSGDRNEALLVGRHQPPTLSGRFGVGPSLRQRLHLLRELPRGGKQSAREED